MRLNPFSGWSTMSAAARGIRVVGAVALAAFAFWTLSPLFYNRVVDEPLATGAAPAMAEQPTAAAMAEDGAMAAKPADAMAEPTAAAMAEDGAMADKPAGDTMAEPTVVAMAEDGAMADKPADAMAEPTAAAMAATPVPAMADKPTADAMAAPTAAAMADTPAATPAPAGPMVLVQGSFVSGRTPGHHTSGSATIHQLEDGTRVLRLENFDTTNGPDLFVTLYTSGNPDEDAGEHLQLAPLKGNQGNQNYELPADLDLSQYRSVVIWCRTFNVVFGYASLAS